MAALTLVALCFLMALQIAQLDLWTLQLQWGKKLVSRQTIGFPSRHFLSSEGTFAPVLAKFGKDVKTSVTSVAFTNTYTMCMSLKCF